jgi:hypothetical protein
MSNTQARAECMPEDIFSYCIDIQDEFVFWTINCN